MSLSWEEGEAVEQRCEHARARLRSRRRRITRFPLGSIFLILALLVVMVFFAFIQGRFASEHRAEQALINAGYSQPRLIHRYDYWVEFRGCGRDDVAKFVFQAINPRLEPVTVSVCEGWPFKSTTVRY